MTKICQVYPYLCSFTEVNKEIFKNFLGNWAENIKKDTFDWPIHKQYGIWFAVTKACNDKTISYEKFGKFKKTF